MNTASPYAAAAPGWDRLDAMFDEVIDAKLLAGAVTLAWQRGRVVHASARGWADLAQGKPMRNDTIIRLYSMTKPVTAAAMMVLWDEGKWRPDDLLARIVPELADLQVVEEDGSLAPAGPITLEHLMTHQAGFTYGFGTDAADMAFRAAGAVSFPYAISTGDYLDRLRRVPLAYQPGEGWRYSVAMDVQGLVIERLSGMAFRDFMLDRVVKPLGMTDTDFMVAGDKRERLAALYMLNDATLVEVPPGPFTPFGDEPPIFASGGAGLLSTAPDYLRFARMLNRGGELDDVRVLSEEATAMMRRSHTPASLLTGGFGTAPHWLRSGYEYAYNGIVVTDPAAAGVALGQGTYFWDGAAGCWFWSDPHNDVVLVCMVQLLADAERLGLQFRSREIVAEIVRDLP